ncbi:hypothetical protein ACTD5D_40255 [Nocardia takedensis]|uniref:hypothetical protein n=1 Tax=Nocardia takedensis TaxID=259390 RepID=UPI003F774A78
MTENPERDAVTDEDDDSPSAQLLREHRAALTLCRRMIGETEAIERLLGSDEPLGIGHVDGLERVHGALIDALRAYLHLREITEPPA